MAALEDLTSELDGGLGNSEAIEAPASAPAQTGGTSGEPESSPGT
jgi:hypothetical protein